jgi:hypothetical protein
VVHKAALEQDFRRVLRSPLPILVPPTAPIGPLKACLTNSYIINDSSESIAIQIRPELLMSNLLLTEQVRVLVLFAKYN